MKEKSAVVKETQNALASSDLMLPFNNAAVLWRAKFLAPSCFLDHLPFLFWLIADIRPTQIVTLGLSDGVAHFAACQAVEKLGLDAVCFGFGLEGDPAEGDNKVPEPDSLSAVLEYNRIQYEEFSTIQRSCSETSADQFEDGSIDLLLLETFLDETQTDALISHWLPKLAAKGVVLLPGRPNVFGDELLKKVRYLVGKQRIIHFQHGNELAIILPDGDLPGQLSALFETVNGNTRNCPIVRFFERMGRQYSMEIAAKIANDLVQDIDLEAKNNRAWVKRLGEENGKLNAIYNEQQDLNAKLKSQICDAQQAFVRVQVQADEAEAKVVTLSGELEIANQATSDLKIELHGKDQELAQLRAELKDANAGLRQRTAEKDQELAQLRAKLEDANAGLRQRITEKDQELAQLCAELENANVGLRQRTADIEIRFEEIAALTGKLNEMELRLDVYKAELQDANANLRQRTAEKDQEISQLRTELENAKAGLCQRTADIEIRFEEIAALTRKLNEIELQLDVSKQENAKISAKIAEKIAVLNLKDSEISNLSDSLDRLDKEVEHLRQERDNLSRTVDDLYSSSSWRITAPVRSIVRTVRRD